MAKSWDQLVLHEIEKERDALAKELKKTKRERDQLLEEKKELVNEVKELKRVRDQWHKRGRVWL